MKRAWRVGVVSLVQETNTLAVKKSTMADFGPAGLLTGETAARQLLGTNTEFAGAVAETVRLGAAPVPLLHAWAMSSGPLTAAALEQLKAALASQLKSAGHLDALVLSMHGALAAENVDCADAALLHTSRDELGRDVPIGVCLDLHANVTNALVESSDFLIGYHTYPHVDQAATGARTVAMLLDLLDGRRAPVTVHTKRPMLIPAEAQDMASGPMADLRQAADAATTGQVLDVSLFPVQPWLDVPELGFAVTVTANGDRQLAANLADEIADRAWRARSQFSVELVEPVAALNRVRASRPGPPIVLSESADSPTAGAAGDSPAMVDVFLKHGRDLRAYVTLVDPPAVAACIDAGLGSALTVRVGCFIDRRFHQPVEISGLVERIGDGDLVLTGPVYTGMKVSMGRSAVVRINRLSVLLTERPAFTFDPQTFRNAGLPPEEADAIVVRSAHLFRAGFAAVTGNAMILDLAGASTPRLETLHLPKAPHPLYPIDSDLRRTKGR
ncbi:MAG: M81 family metallopeptidase [Candidatus Dormibacteraceae bacterium]